MIDTLDYSASASVNGPSNKQCPRCFECHPVPPPRNYSHSCSWMKSCSFNEPSRWHCHEVVMSSSLSLSRMYVVVFYAACGSPSLSLSLLRVCLSCGGDVSLSRFMHVVISSLCPRPRLSLLRGCCHATVMALSPFMYVMTRDSSRS